VTRSFACALLAIAATLAACVDLSQPLVLQQGTGGDQGGSATSAATGGSGGTATVASGGSHGGTATGGTVTGGTVAGGATATGGAGGSAVPDAAVDAAVDVPYSPDAIRPSDLSTGGSAAGASGSGGGGTGGTAGQAGSASGGQTSTGGTAVAGSGGSTGGTTGQAGSSGGATGGASSTATGGAGATGGTTTATGGVTATCTPVPKSTGGLSCPNGLCTVGAYSGYDFTFSDKIASSVCMLPNNLCGAGTVGAQNPAGGYTVWGAGFGFSLSTLTTATTETPVQLAGTGVTVTVTSLPTNADMRLQVKHYVGAVGTTYCAIMTTATQTIPWTSFNTMCWAPATGVALTGPPNTSNFQFQASSRLTAGSFDFCVTALSFK